MSFAPLLFPSNHWMDLLVAADYVGIAYDDLLAAAVSGELDASLTHPHRVGEWMVRMGTVEQWARLRGVRLLSA